MNYIILLDFGSTFTKAVVVSPNDSRIICTAKVPSTVKTDATICLENCLAEIRQQIGSYAVQNAQILTSSSAAGGLRMSVCGLTASLSISAGRNVSFGAGAKIVHISSGLISDEDLNQIIAKQTEMILLCGGYEDGCKTTLIENAVRIADSQINCPVIYAGNSKIAETVKLILLNGNKECFISRNVIPNVGILDPTSAEATIRNLFMRRIVNMKGLDKVQASIGDILMPTPAAVLSAGELLSKGTIHHSGIGDLLIVDIGGATTDIHSYAEQKPFKGARCIGAPEPYIKRTVEGDLGMRESCNSLCDEVGAAALSQAAGIDEIQLQASISRRISQNDYLADSPEEVSLDTAIARFASRLAVRRHCGRIERVISSNCNRLQIGKNLTSVRTIIGTGGVIINSDNPTAILQEVIADPSIEPDTLLPETASIHIDSEYILYAIGLLRTYDENLAYTIMKNSIN